MSRTILKSRPPASPNKPPPTPMKMPMKGNPLPINVNLLITGNTCIYNEQEEQRLQQELDEGKLSKYSNKGIAQVSKLQSFSPCLDKHVLRSLIRAPSVDDSFYDRFERLDRDFIVGDVANKDKSTRTQSATSGREKNVFSRLTEMASRPSSASVRIPTSRVSSATSRVSSATSRVSSATSRVSSATSRVSSAKSRNSSAKSKKYSKSRANSAKSRASSASSRKLKTTPKTLSDVTTVSSETRSSQSKSHEPKRPQSAPVFRKTHKHTPETFFDLAISMDDETRQNTITNAESKTDIKSAGLEQAPSRIRPKSASVRRRPRSGRKPRARSRSRRRSFVEGAEDRRISKKNPTAPSSPMKLDVQKIGNRSRSRARLDLKQVTNGCDNTESNAENTKRHDCKDQQRLLRLHEKRRRKSKTSEQKVSLEDCLYTDVASTVSTKKPTPPKIPKGSRATNQATSKETTESPIDIVSKANDAQKTIKRLEETDRLLYNRRRYSSSCLPKLKMIVASPSMPLAALVRTSSAKMLMNMSHGPKKETLIV